MKFTLRTKDGKFYLKTFKPEFQGGVTLTQDPQLAMRFPSRPEANRMGMRALNGEFEVVAL